MGRKTGARSVPHKGPRAATATPSLRAQGRSRGDSGSGDSIFTQLVLKRQPLKDLLQPPAPWRQGWGVCGGVRGGGGAGRVAAGPPGLLLSAGLGDAL